MGLFVKKAPDPLEGMSDSELLAHYKKSADNDCIGIFYKRYFHILYGVCLKYLKNESMAEDTAYDIFQHMYLWLLKYEIKDFKFWLLTIARNESLKVIKNDGKWSEINENSTNLSSDFMESEGDITLIEEKEASLQNLERAIAQLKPEQEQCIRMFYIDELSYKEIVDKTGYDMKKVKSYIQNGKRNLQILMNASHE